MELLLYALARIRATAFRGAVGMFFRRYSTGAYEDAAVWARKAAEAYCIISVDAFGGKDRVGHSGYASSCTELCLSHIMRAASLSVDVSALSGPGAMKSKDRHRHTPKIEQACSVQIRAEACSDYNLQMEKILLDNGEL